MEGVNCDQFNWLLWCGWIICLCFSRQLAWGRWKKVGFESCPKYIVCVKLVIDCRLPCVNWSIVPQHTTVSCLSTVPGVSLGSWAYCPPHSPNNGGSHTITLLHLFYNLVIKMFFCFFLASFGTFKSELNFTNVHNYYGNCWIFF